jgi:hypothetical protein
MLTTTLFPVDLGLGACKKATARNTEYFGRYNHFITPALKIKILRILDLQYVIFARTELPKLRDTQKAL